ncbi:hypothetical protein NGRA_2154 [Nosema granulosis]|uniref:Uncharacterized protein n=1 Tax=Nosema granulosis TaxID=83296 RepID=A0A9P6KYH0_9MICR|nr:hypothetical protein NGRA_2154 [Nosema granulosis]
MPHIRFFWHFVNYAISKLPSIVSMQQKTGCPCVMKIVFMAGNSVVADLSCKGTTHMDFSKRINYGQHPTIFIVNLIVVYKVYKISDLVHSSILAMIGLIIGLVIKAQRA